MSTISTLPSNLLTGTSGFASTLSQVLTRAEGIASLPLQSLEAKQTDLTNRQSALQGVDNVFASLQTSIGNLQSAVTSGVLTPSVSDNTVTVNAGPGATPASYRILVTDPGSWSNALSTSGAAPVSDPSTQGISDLTSYTLNVNGNLTTITAADSSLNALVSAINAEAGSQVSAVVVNVGAPGSPDYRLSLQSAALGPNTIDLTDSSGNDLIASSTPGALATYSVDGSGAVSSSSRTVTIAPGVTATLVNQTASGQPATITVSNSPNTLINAFGAFAQAYNNAVATLGQYHGQNGGVLEGDSLISSLTNVLQRLGNYNGGSPEATLANYGVTLGPDGRLSVDAAALTSAASSNFQGLLALVGSSTSGGFLQSATGLLNSVEDPVNGSVKQAETGVANQITAQQAKISAAQAALSTMEQNLQKQISNADAAIAALETQVSYVSGLFAASTGNSNASSNFGGSAAQINPQQL